MMAIETLAPNVAHLFSSSRLSETATKSKNHRQQVTLSPVINKLAKSVKCNDKISQKSKIAYPKNSTSTNSSPKKVHLQQKASRTRSVSYNVENLNNSNSTVKNNQVKKNYNNNRKDEKSSSGCHSDTSTTSSKTGKKFVKLARLHTKEEQKKIENTRSRSPTNSRQHRNSFSRMISNEQGGHYARHAETFAGCAASPAATALPRPPVSWLKSSQVPTEKFKDNSHISTKTEESYIMKQQPSTSENVQEFFASFQSLMVSTA
jgi:hypothetical protein